MQNVRRYLIVLVLSLMMNACSMAVPQEEVYGTYVASYPFGTDTLVLNRNGTFEQLVALKNEQPVTVRGSWDFDPEESRIRMYDSLVVADGFGKLRSDWRKVGPGVASLPVKRLWFKLVIGSGGEHPYVRQ
jgi:hypothetical protein